MTDLCHLIHQWSSTQCLDKFIWVRLPYITPYIYMHLTISYFISLKQFMNSVKTFYTQLKCVELCGKLSWLHFCFCLKVLLFVIYFSYTGFYVSQLFISRKPKMRAIPQLVSAPLNPIPIAEHFRRSHPPCEHSRGQHI